jgi:TIR domain
LVASLEDDRQIYKPQRKINNPDLPPSGLDTQQYKFDVFLCHNSKDKADVEMICEALRKRRIKPWLDSSHKSGSGLLVGDDISPVVKDNIKLSKFIAVFIGENGLGTYQKKELKFICEERHKGRSFTIIPVFLADRNEIISHVPPCFLGESYDELLYADFSKPRFNGLNQLSRKIKSVPKNK